MSSSAVRLPSRFPVGTRFVIEGREGRIHLRYLEFPDGRQVELPAETGVRSTARRRRALPRSGAENNFWEARNQPQAQGLTSSAGWSAPSPPTPHPSGS